MLELGIGVKVAVTSAMASYIAAGLTGTYSYLRENSIDARGLYFCLGATPGAFMGAFAVHRLRDQEIAIAAYILILASTIFTLVRLALDCMRRKDEEKSPSPSQSVKSDAKRMTVVEQDVLTDECEQGKSLEPKLLPSSKRLLVGFVVGFGSALTGTSGPVLILPILFLLEDMPSLAALGIAQTIQVGFLSSSWIIVRLIFLGTDPNFDCCNCGQSHLCQESHFRTAGPPPCGGSLHIRTNRSESCA